MDALVHNAHVPFVVELEAQDSYRVGAVTHGNRDGVGSVKQDAGIEQATMLLVKFKLTTSIQFFDIHPQLKGNNLPE